MKNFLKRFLSIALAAVIGFSMLGCDYIGSVIDKIKGDDKKSKETKVKYVMDISDKTKNWDCMVVGTDGSSMVFKMNQTTFRPSRLYVKPKKDSDAGISFLFKDNGLLDRMICNGTIFYFGNYNGYKFDMAVIKPDGAIEYHYDNQSDVNWDTYWDKNLKRNINERSVQERSVQIQRNIFHLFEEQPFTIKNFLDCLGTGAGMGTCIGGIFFPPALVGCGIFVLSQITSEVYDRNFKDTATNDVAQTLLDALGCVTLDPIDCASTVVDVYSLIFDKDVNDANKKNDKTNEAKDTIEKRSPPPEPVAVTGVSLNKTTLSLTVGEIEYLHATVSPANATNKATDWTSSNANIATVDKYGDVTAVAPGTATITVTTVDGNYKATCAVTVTAPTGPKVGDKGPGGGIIFYYDAVGFPVGDGPICHYLEAAPNDLGKFYFYSTGLGPRTVHFVTTDGIGAGKGNTGLILGWDPDAPAARACRNYSGGGKTDWYLPSKVELGVLYENRALVGNMVGDVAAGYSSGGSYHSSSLNGTPQSDGWTSLSSNYRLEIETGKFTTGWGENWVRAIRAF